MNNAQSSEFTESIQDLKNFQVYIRVKPNNKDELLQQLSSRKSQDRFKRNNFSAQQSQLSQLYGSFSPLNSSQNSKKIRNQLFNNCQSNQQIFESENGQNRIYNSDRLIKVDEDENIIILNDPEYRNIDNRQKLYQFDGVLSENSTNDDVFQKAVLPQLNGVLEGYNSTFLAYGITGSGKTHTIFGKDGGQIQLNNQINSKTQNPQSSRERLDQNQIIKHNQNDDKIIDRGICYMAIEYLLQNLNKQTSVIKFSFLEIYNENVRDLLNGYNNLKNLTIIEDPTSKNICVQDLKEYTITCTEEIEELISEGNQRRALAPTSANQFSSRSHAILILTIQMKKQDPVTKQDEILTSKLTIIDLAGSEKGSDKQGKGSLEGSNINKSLLALGNCINILSEKKRVGHIPYRDSKLTRILKDTLGGNTKTVMIACISQNYSSLDETINTLNYASRATNIKRKISKNITLDLDCQQQKDLIRELQSELALYKGQSNINKQQTSNTNSSNFKQCENCQKNKKSSFFYDCSNLESVYDKSTAQSSFDTKQTLKIKQFQIIKQEKKVILGQIQEITEMIKQSLELDSYSGEEIISQSIEEQIRIRNEQQNNQEDYLNRICNDIFQNVIESHQLTTSLQEIEELLAQDYEKLTFYQKNPSQNSQVLDIINQIQQSIDENQEIKEKIKMVLETNQDQKQNLKYVLIRISDKKSIQMEYDLKLRKQQLELLDLLEIKNELEKQLTIQNRIAVEKDKLIEQITKENLDLKQQNEQQKLISRSNSSTEQAQSQKTVISFDNNKHEQQDSQLKQQNNLNIITNNKSLSYQPQLQQQPLQQKISSFKQDINVIPLTKDLLNYDQNQIQIPEQGIHSIGCVNQPSIQIVNSPQFQYSPVSVTPKNDQKIQNSVGYSYKNSEKVQIDNPNFSQTYHSESNFLNYTLPDFNTQETNLPLTFTSYKSVPQISLTNSNNLIQQSNFLNLNTNQIQPQQQNNTIPIQKLQKNVEQKQNITILNGLNSNSNISLNTTNNISFNNIYDQEKENQKYQQKQQDNYTINTLNSYSSNQNQANASIINYQQPQQLLVIPQQSQQMYQYQSQMQLQKDQLLIEQDAQQKKQKEFKFNNQQEQSCQFAINIVQSSIISQQGLSKQQFNQGGTNLKNETQNTIIDLTQNSFQIPIQSSQEQINNNNSNNKSGSLLDKVGQSKYIELQQPQLLSPQLLSPQLLSPSLVLNSTVNDINNLSVGQGLISSYKRRSQNRSGRYDDDNNSFIEKAKQSDKLQLNEGKQFLEEQSQLKSNLSYSSLNCNQQQQPQTNSYMILQDKDSLISPMNKYQNPIESFDRNSQNKIQIDQTQKQQVENGYDKKTNNIYQKYEQYSQALQSSLTPQQQFQDKAINPIQQSYQSVEYRTANRIINDTENNCEPKIISRRSTNHNEQQVNEQETNRNPLETENDMENDDGNNSYKKNIFENSPNIHQSSRTVQVANINLKMKNFDILENEE